MKVYKHFHTDEKVDEDEAFDYVMEELLKDGNESLLVEFEENFGKDIVNWFFSGNWIEEEEDNCNGR